MNTLAYHVVVHAVEGSGGWTPLARFTSSLSHIINGHLPYQRHHAAGLARAAKGATDSQIENSVSDFLQTDLTAGVTTICQISRPEVMIAAFNSYNESAGIGVQTNVAVATGDQGSRVLQTRRQTVLASPDPALCQTATLAMFQGLLAEVTQNAGKSRILKRSIHQLSADLGVSHTATAQAAEILEGEGYMSVAALASIMGCHQRTLERRLRSEGMTAETIRQATRLHRAANRLQSEASLTTIAIEEGFSDLSHMTRAFKASSAFQPSVLRKILRANTQALSAADERKVPVDA